MIAISRYLAKDLETDAFHVPRHIIASRLNGGFAFGDTLNSVSLHL